MESWIQVNPASGKGNSDVDITLQENTEGEDRETILKIVTAGNIQKLINILQKGIVMNIWYFSNNTIYKVNNSTGEYTAITENDKEQLFKDAKNHAGLFYVNAKELYDVSYEEGAILFPEVIIYSSEAKIFSLENKEIGWRILVFNGGFSLDSYPNLANKMTFVLDDSSLAVTEILINGLKTNKEQIFSNIYKYNKFVEIYGSEFPLAETHNSSGDFVLTAAVYYNNNDVRLISTTFDLSSTSLSNLPQFTVKSLADKVYVITFPSDTDGAEATSITLNGEEIPGNELPIAPTNPEEKLPNARFFIAAGNNFYEAFCSVKGFTGSLVFMKGGIGIGGAAEGITFGQIVLDSAYTPSLHYFSPSYA